MEVVKEIYQLQRRVDNNIVTDTGNRRGQQ
jgi:hypothetical protein